MAAFLLNPYDSTLNIADKDDRKLYQDACKGLPEANRFDGKRHNYADFTKLIAKHLKDTRVMEALKIAVKWDTSAADTEGQKLPTTEGIIDLFSSNKVTKEQVVEHCELVWSDSNYGNDTTRYFAKFATPPTSEEDLISERNKRRMKHVMMGYKLWNSLTSSFQLDIIGGREEFEKANETDGVLLWDFIRRRVNPSTTVGASKLKDEIETRTLAEFDHDVIKYNTWFSDTREKIVREEGDGYNEYLRSLFRAYRTSNNTEFNESIGEERRKWIQGKLRDSYNHTDLMDLARLTFNNLVEDSAWQETKNKVDREENNYLALATEILKRFKVDDGGKNTGGKTQKRGGEGTGNGREYAPWRFENPNGDTTKVMRGTTLKWCTKDCHAKSMWCGRKVCLSKAEFAAKYNKKTQGEKDDDNEKVATTKDFRIALAALTSQEDFDSLESQFFPSKE